jgi:hypothetical protein
LGTWKRREHCTAPARGFLAGKPAVRYTSSRAYRLNSVHAAGRGGGGVTLQPAGGILWRDMEIRAPSLTAATPIAIVAVAFAIFVVDALVHVDIAIPVLYVAVVLMSVRLYEVRGVLIVSGDASY